MAERRNPLRLKRRFRIAAMLNRVFERGSLGRSVTTLATGTAIGQIVSLVALPFLTRLYSPHQYGGAAVYAGIVGLIVAIAALRYEFAIPLPRRDGAAFSVLLVAASSVLIVGALAGLGYAAIRPFWRQNTGLPDLLFLTLLAFGTISAGSYNVLNYWTIRKQRFGLISRTRVEQGVAATATQLLLGFGNVGALGLIVGQILGQCAGVTRLLSSLRRDRQDRSFLWSRKRLAWASRRYNRFPIYDAPAALLNMASIQAPVLLFAGLFSPVLAGYYALAIRLVSAPNVLLGRAVSQALIPKVVAAHRSGSAGPLVLQLIRVLSWLSFFPFAVLASVAGDIVPLAFGARWTPAALIVSWTCAWAAWQLLAGPMVTVLTSLEAQRANTIAQAILLTTRMAAIFFGAAMDSTAVAIEAFAIASIVGYMAVLWAVCSAVNMKLHSILQSVAPPALLAGTYLLIIWVAHPYFEYKFLVVSLFTVIWALSWLYENGHRG